MPSVQFEHAVSVESFIEMFDQFSWHEQGVIIDYLNRTYTYSDDSESLAHRMDVMLGTNLSKKGLESSETMRERWDSLIACFAGHETRLSNLEQTGCTRQICDACQDDDRAIHDSIKNLRKEHDERLSTVEMSVRDLDGLELGDVPGCVDDHETRITDLESRDHDARITDLEGRADANEKLWSSLMKDKKWKPK